MKKEIIATKAMDGRKIEYILSGDLALSGNIIKKLKMSGGILLNGENTHTDRRLQEGDRLELVFPDEANDNILPCAMELDIIYEDEDILAVNKPAAMETHPSKGNNTATLANGVVNYFGDRFSFHVITRLDKDTSGVVLIAKNAVAAHTLSKAMQQHQIQKKYVAVVCGTAEKPKGVINAPIKRGEGIRRIVAPDGKAAVTEYCFEKTIDGLSLVSLCPLTGRTHQIRVHLAHIGTPIYGDWLYGNGIDGERVRLHCKSVTFAHPSTGKKMTLEAPLPGDIASLVK